MNKANKNNGRKAAIANSRKQQSILDRLDALTKALPKGTFQALGTGGGFLVGGPAGAAVGSAIGKGISTITGRGDYVVRSNSIATTGLAGSYERSPVDDLPQFTRGTHTVNVKHREYFGDLVVPENPTVFDNTAYTIQPSNTALFPWLARIARQYQQYRIHGMVVEFKSNTTDYAAAGPLGSVGIATNYNTADAKFDSLVEFQNCEFATVSKPSHNILHAIECHPALGRGEWLYVKDASQEDPTQVQDSRFNDFGKLQVCTSGLPGEAGSTLGQLWVSYDIEFAKPVLGSSDPGPDLVPGTAILSTPDSGTLVSSSTSDQCTRSWQCTNIAPSPSQQIPVFDSQAVVGSTGNISSEVVYMSTAANAVHFKRPGSYIVMWEGALTQGVNKFALADLTNQDYTVSVINEIGTPVYSYNTASGNQIPYCFSSADVGTGYYHVLETVNIVSADDSNYIVVSPPQFNTHTGNMIASYTRGLRVYWLAKGDIEYVNN